LREAPWRVAFGPSIDLTDLEALPRKEATRVATQRLWHRIERLQEQLR
jgi:hypothetical protein